MVVISPLFLYTNLMTPLKKWLKQHKISGKELAKRLDLTYFTVKNAMNNEEIKAYPLTLISLYTGIQIEHLLPFDCQHKVKTLKDKLNIRPKIAQYFNDKKLDISGVSYPRFSQFSLMHIDTDIVTLKSTNGETHHINLSTFKRYFRESPKHKVKAFLDLIENK